MVIETRTVVIYRERTLAGEGIREFSRVVEMLGF